MDGAEEWIRVHVEPAGPLEPVKVRPWATTLRVPTRDGCVYFKACGGVQRFEPRLTSQLASRWAGRVADVVAYDEQRAWLLLADAGQPMGLDRPPEVWLDVLPAYAELQHGEAERAQDHVDHGVPDLRLATLPGRYEAMAARDLPLAYDEAARLRAFAPRFAELCVELAAHGIRETAQHDDLHGNNVYGSRILDWGDASIAHPFFSLVVTFRFLHEQNRLKSNDPWFARLRDAYLEPWGRGNEETFSLALRVGWFAHVVAWTRQRDHIPQGELPRFDGLYPHMLRRALDFVVE